MHHMVGTPPFCDDAEHRSAPMTWPINHQPPAARSPIMSTASALVSRFAGASAGDGAVERFERVAGSLFIGLFGAALFDQAMLPAVSAALEDTGRIRNTLWLRALRSAASDQIVFCGHPADRRAEAERLVRLHREVKGVGANGIRYSALTPELWNWILISTFFMHRNAAVVIAGENFTDADNQAIWDRFRELSADLQLPGGAQLMDSYDELCTYYDTVVAQKLEATPTLECVVDGIIHPRRPDFIPAATAPVWKLTAPVAGHVVAVLGFGVMHPGVRALLPMAWTRRHDLEFTALAFLLRLAYRALPVAITDTPLTRNRHNRRKYEQIMAKYTRIALPSFAPDYSAAKR
jgi:uncharacterized protein (DUF2236 family)